MIRVSEMWKSACPGAAIGFLAMRAVSNPEAHPLLVRRRQELEAELRKRYGSLDRAQLKTHPVLRAYAAYYKRFGKTYHLQLQLESVAFKNRSLPAASALVEAMFAAELANLLLTAGHDLDAVRGELLAEVASGQESYTLLNGQQQVLKPGDMFIRDQQGVLSSVIHGPDYRTRIVPATKRVLFTVYAPAGIETAAVEEHLGQLKASVLLVAPGAEVEGLGVVGRG
jgi:DNA/RNA-binding domain of Phe-tRNA-synthetase-like protein